MARKFVSPFDDMLNKSIKELKANSKAVETAIEKFLTEEGIDVSEKEFTEIKQLTDTMDELDSALLTLGKAKPKKTAVKKKKAKKKSKKKSK